MPARPTLAPTLLSAMMAVPARVGGALEPQTAQLPAQANGALQLVDGRRSTSKGQDDAAPRPLEHGITDRLAFAVSPVPYTSIRPKLRRSASGLGVKGPKPAHLEASGTDNLNAFAAAGGVKGTPAGKSRLGTGGHADRVAHVTRTRFGPFDFHEYAPLAKATVRAKCDNIADLAVGADLAIAPKRALVSEVLGDNSAGGNKAEAGGARDASVSTVTRFVGAVDPPADRNGLSRGLGYGGESATLLRPSRTTRV